LYLKLIRPIARRLVPIKYRPQLLRLYYTMRAPFYRGTRVSCPCCAGNFRRFLPYAIEGRPARPNAQCPGCGAAERHRLIWLFMKNRTNLFANHLRFLHIAPEPVFQQRFKSMSNLDYIGADINSPLADVKMDITDIQYEDDFFDAILCSHVLDYVADDRKAMHELYRVLRPGGWAILQSLVDRNREMTFEDNSIVAPKKRKEVFGQSDLFRIYGRDYAERIRKAGFELTIVDYAQELGPDLCAKYGLIPDDIIYYCTKSKN